MYYKKSSYSMVPAGISGVALRNVFWAENDMCKLGEMRYLIKRDVSECIWQKLHKIREVNLNGIGQYCY